MPLRRDMGSMVYHMPRPFTAALALGLATLGLAAAPAYASVEPTPPPSGIVYHLFGPNSITSHILPSGPSAPAPPGGAAPAAAGTASSGVQPAGTTAPASPGPSWGDVAHQMFVTGDPAQEGAPQIPKGRAGE
jgi:hypothetical protein